MSIEDAWGRAWALARLLPLLSGDQVGEARAAAMRAALAVHSDSERVSVLLALAPVMPTDMDAVSAALMAATAPTNQHIPESLRKLVPHLSPVQMDAALAGAVGAAKESDRGQALIDIAPYLSTGQIDLAWTCADRLSGNLRGLALAALFSNADAEQPTGRSDTVLRAVLDLFGDTVVARTLADIAPLLSAEQLQRARARVEELPTELARGKGLAWLIPHMPTERSALVEAALAAVAGAGDEAQRALILRELLPHLPEPRRAEVVAGWLSPFVEPPGVVADLDDRVLALQSIGPDLPGEDASRAAAAVFDRIVAMTDRPRWWLHTLAVYVPADRLDAAIAAARELASDHDRVIALKALAPRLSAQQFDAAWACAESIRETGFAVRTMVELARHLPAAGRAAAMARALTHACQPYAEYPADPFMAIAPHLDEAQRAVAIEAAERLDDPADRAAALTHLARGDDPAPGPN